jgi:hypothetical protein
VSDSTAVEDQPGVPTFSECVIGYRAWLLDRAGQLWPVAGYRKAWSAGINTARCECGTSDRLHFEWAVVDGRRVLKPAPLHDAPQESCSCGLYSLRQPKASWGTDVRFDRGDQVAGAVASWGRIQVHATGVRAEHACVLALALAPDCDATAAQRVRLAAQRYGVPAVALADLQEAASEHGRPLPDTLHQAADRPDEPTGGPPASDVDPNWQPAPNATEDHVDNIAAARPRQVALRRGHLALALAALLTGLIILLIVLDHRSSPCKLQIINIAGGATIEQCATNSAPAH